MQNPNQNPTPDTARRVDAGGLQKLFAQIYALMCASIVGSLVIAFFVAKAHLFLAGLPLIAVAILWMIIPIVISTTATKHPMFALIGLIVFVALAGLFMGNIFVAYTAGVITAALVAASALFVTMSVIGFTTKKDVSNWRTQLTAMLIAVIVVSLVNVFLHSSVVEMIVCGVTIVIFTIMTMVDTASIKQQYAELGAGESTMGLVISGCLSLYLDFINLFLRLLELFAFLSGNSNDN